MDGRTPPRRRRSLSPADELLICRAPPMHSIVVHLHHQEERAIATPSSMMVEKEDTSKDLFLLQLDGGQNHFGD